MYLVRQACARLSALTPLDGRYSRQSAELLPFFSEEGLMSYRLRVQIHWLTHLLKSGVVPDNQALATCLAALAQQAGSPSHTQKIKQIELKTNHDVKAVQLHLKSLLKDRGLGQSAEYVHLCLTSQDVNNVAYALLLKDALHQVLLPAYSKVRGWLVDNARQEADSAMLARTHGQPATPTTMGKELANFGYRLGSQIEHMRGVRLRAKCNGAVGNFNAHYFAYPEFNWLGLSQQFVEGLGLEHNPFTTQIESHDSLARLANEAALANTILISFCRDMWTYISLAYFRQKVVADEVGSSTMPHKVNPISFENAEGNFGVANSLLQHFSSKLPISRLQRDLSDSTVLRTQGTAFGHTLLALKSLSQGLSRVQCDRQRLTDELDCNKVVIAEAIQTLLRRKQVPGAYEMLKDLTRGKEFDSAALEQLLQRVSAHLSKEEVERVRALTPRSYLGKAADLARSLK